MSVESHIKSLQMKHAELEHALSQEIAHPQADFYLIKDIKKQKLLIKEEISRLMHGLEVRHQSA